MPIVEPKIRSSPLKILFIILLFCACLFVLLWKFENVFQEIDFSDFTTLCLLFYVAGSVILMIIIFHLFLLFGFEYFPSLLISIRSTFDHIANDVCLFALICLDIVGFACLVSFFLLKELKLNWDYFLVSICASVLFACVLLVIDYNDNEISSCQNMKKSIGYSWASTDYSVFYKQVLEIITKRISDFEKKEGISFLVKKLVIICPLSCNANGTLEHKDGAMQIIGKLEEIIFDDGGANRRPFFANVYKIAGPYDMYITAIIPSPLSVLYEMKDILDISIFEYHRDCFIETLKDLTRSEKCIILKYDDINSPEELHSFLLSRLQDKKFVSVIK